MLPAKKKLRSNNVQLAMLVDYMSSHKLFANGEFTGPLGNQRMQQQWEEVRTILSEHGPDKTVDQWKHTWRDLKKRSREEGARIRQAREKTGNASFVPSMSELSSKVLNVIGMECAFGIGDPGETGIGSFTTQPRPATTTTTCSTNFLLPNCSSIVMEPSSHEISVSNQDSLLTEPLQQQASPALIRRPAYQPHTVRAPTPSQSPMVLAPSPSQTHAVPAPTPLQHHTVTTPTPSQQRRTGLGGRADEFLAAEQETNNILREILNTMQEGLVQNRMKYRQMLRQARTKRFK